MEFFLLKTIPKLGGLNNIHDFSWFGGGGELFSAGLAWPSQMWSGKVYLTGWEVFCVTLCKIVKQGQGNPINTPRWSPTFLNFCILNPIAKDTGPELVLLCLARLTWFAASFAALCSVQWMWLRTIGELLVQEELGLFLFIVNKY